MQIWRFGRKNFTVSKFLIVLSLLLLITAITATDGYSASSAWQPTKTIEIIVGTSAGSGSDRFARAMQVMLKKNNIVNASIVVVNKPGGGGEIAWDYLNKHGGDGHYILPCSPGILTNYISGASELTYTDFTPLAVVSFTPSILAVNAASSIKTVQDLARIVKKDLQSISWGNTMARGNYTHADKATVVKALGGDVKKMNVVIFDSSGKEMMALLGGHVDVISGGPENVDAQVQAGKLRVILSLAPPGYRKGAYSNVPSWKEIGVDGSAGNTRSVMGPKGLSQAQIAYWDDVFAKLTHTTDWKEYLKKEYAEDLYKNSQDAVKHLEAEFKRYKDVLTELGFAKKRG